MESLPVEVPPLKSMKSFLVRRSMHSSAVPLPEAHGTLPTLSLAPSLTAFSTKSARPTNAGSSTHAMSNLPSTGNKAAVSSSKHGKSSSWKHQKGASKFNLRPFEDGVPQTFDLWFWGSGKCNDLWDEFRDSPVSRLLKPSHVVESAVARNMYLLSPRGPKPPLGASSDPFDRMLAIHIRRGDYKESCMGLAQWNSTFYSWNLLPFLPDKFHLPPGWDVDRNETITTYTETLFPN
jgi:hypothetical protein